MGYLKIKYVIYATLIAIIFGEITPALLNGTFEHWKTIAIPISIYYVFLTFIFSLFVFRIKLWKSLVVFFVFGAIIEWLLFGNIGSPLDVLGVFFFGTLYIALFGVPYLLVIRKER